jgi:uncharacterized membrane protein
MKLKPADVGLILVCAALFAVGCIASVYLVVVPGVIQLRPGAAFAPLFGVLFGPFIGGVSTFIGSFIWIALLYPASSWTIPISAFGDALYSAIPGYMCRNAYPPNLKKVAFWTLIGAGAMSCLQGMAMFLLGWFPLSYAIGIVFAADMPMGVIGGPILIALLHKRVKAMGLYHTTVTAPLGRWYIHQLTEFWNSLTWALRT